MKCADKNCWGCGYWVETPEHCPGFKEPEDSRAPRGEERKP